MRLLARSSSAAACSFDFLSERISVRSCRRSAASCFWERRWRSVSRFSRSSSRCLSSNRAFVSWTSVRCACVSII